MQITLCENCEWYFGDLQCVAFPTRIPDEILDGLNPHKEPLPDQENDFVFKLKYGN